MTLVHGGVTTVLPEGTAPETLENVKKYHTLFNEKLPSISQTKLEDLIKKGNYYQRYKALEELWEGAFQVNLVNIFNPSMTISYIFQEKFDIEVSENKATNDKAMSILKQHYDEMGKFYPINERWKAIVVAGLYQQYWPQIKNIAMDQRTTEAVDIISKYFINGNKVVSSIWGRAHIFKMGNDLKNNNVSYALLVPKSLLGYDFNREPTLDEATFGEYSKVIKLLDKLK